MGHSKPYYDAEFEVRFLLENGGITDFYGSTLVIPVERRFGTLENVETYLTKVCEWLDLGEPPKVRARRGNKDAHYEAQNRVIAVPEHRGSQNSWAMREIVVLHELAHHVAWGHGHDAVWCGTLIHLINKCIGPEIGLLLSAAFTSRGVQIKNYTV